MWKVNPAQPCWEYPELAIVWTGSEYGAAWGLWGHYYQEPQIAFSRLDATGNKIGDDVQVTFTPDRSWPFSLVWTGTEYGVVWTERNESEGSLGQDSAGGERPNTNPCP